MQRIVGETECKSKSDFKIHTHPGRDHNAKCMKRRESQTLGSREEKHIGPSLAHSPAQKEAPFWPVLLHCGWSNLPRNKAKG